MKKCNLLLITTLLFSLFAFNSNANFNPNIMNKYSYLVVNQKNGMILYEKHADEHRYPASITKLMSSYIFFKYLKEEKIKLSDKITVSKYAASQAPIRLGLRPNMSITVKDAVNAAVIKSANDATVALAEHIAGSDENFVRLMNKVAKQIALDFRILNNLVQHMILLN